MKTVFVNRGPVGHAATLDATIGRLPESLKHFQYFLFHTSTTAPARHRPKGRLAANQLRVDHTAFVVVEQQVVVTAQRDPVSYEYVREGKLYVRLVERVRLGQGFHEVVSEIERLTQCEELHGGLVTTAVDATGLGIVVSEDLRRKRLRGELYPVVITGGLEGSCRDGFYPTPRTELLLGVQKAFEQEGLGGWDLLERELKAMRKVQSARGPRFATMGTHDDLVFALALALFGARRMRVLPVEGELVRRRCGLF